MGRIGFLSDDDSEENEMVVVGNDKEMQVNRGSDSEFMLSSNEEKEEEYFSVQSFSGSSEDDSRSTGRQKYQPKVRALPEQFVSCVVM